MTLYNLGLEIHDNGMWEEFHQKRHNYTMYDHHFSRRKKLQAEYNRRKAQCLLTSSDNSLE
jgi:hypothetical protein